jgi:predicted nucleotidyltransferase
MKTPEERLARLAGDLKTALGGNFRSAVLYGSAARGDHAGRNSDLNVMVEVEDGAPRVLEPAAAVQRRWEKDGNPPLLIVTGEWIRNSTDVFPLEFMDMLAAHKVFHGEDPLAGVTVSSVNLRLQCEHELRSLVLKLRSAYLDAHGRAGDLRGLIVASFGSVATVARAALRLAGEEVPPRSEAVLEAAAKRFGLETSALHQAARVKQGLKVKDREQMKTLYLKYFDQVASLSRALDGMSPGAHSQERGT